MKTNRTQNAVRNIIFGLILQIYQIAMPFFMRTVMMYWMGVEYLGLNSLFVSILNTLNLAELGVGVAMTYSMYRPLASNDTETMCAILRLYRTYYRVIGLIIATVGVLLLPVVPRLVRSDVPEGISLQILYLLHLSVSVLSYWLYAYRSSLLTAHQRTDILNKISLLANTFQYSVQAAVLFFLRNYYLYLSVSMFTQILQNILIGLYTAKAYPQYKPKGNLKEAEKDSINRRIRDLVTTKFGAVVIGSADTIVISAFMGLTSLAIYQNYYYVMSSVCRFVQIIYTAVIAGIGNSLITDTTEKNYRDFRKFSFIVNWILCVCSCCMIGLFQPFMRMWAGEKLMLPFSCVILFCAYFYVHELMMLWATFKDAAGIWHIDRFRTLAGAVFNLTLNLILVNFIGFYGILLSTILSYLLISMPWLLRNLFTFVFQRSAKEYAARLALYIVCTLLSCALTVWTCDKISLGGVLGLAVRLCAAVCVSCAAQWVAFGRLKECREAAEFLKEAAKLRRSRHE